MSNKSDNRKLSRAYRTERNGDRQYNVKRRRVNDRSARYLKNALVVEYGARFDAAYGSDDE